MPFLAGFVLPVIGVGRCMILGKSVELCGIIQRSIKPKNSGLCCFDVTIYLVSYFR